MTDDKLKPTQADLRDAIEAAIVAKSIEIIRGETLPAMGSVLTQYADAAFEVVRATDTQVSSLVSALEWYANPEVYKPHPHGLAFDDRDLSWKARAALDGMGSKPGA